MKRFLLRLLIRKLPSWIGDELDRLGQINPGLYRSIMGILITLNTIVLDPEVAENVRESFGDSHWATRTIHIVSMVLMALLGPRQKKSVPLTPGGTYPTNHVQPTRKRKKFLGI